MSRSGGRAKALFLGWLIALPEEADPTLAATAFLAKLRADSAPIPEREELCALLRQVTPFAMPGAALRRRRRDRGARGAN